MKYLKTIAEFNSFQNQSEDVMYTHHSAGYVDLDEADAEDVELRDLMEIDKKEGDVESNEKPYT